MPRAQGRYGGRGRLASVCLMRGKARVIRQRKSRPACLQHLFARSDIVNHDPVPALITRHAMVA